MSEFSYKDYANYRIERAMETIAEIEKHIENKFWNTAINRMYYACFYAVSALLIKNGISASSHSGIRLQFGKNFIKTGLIDKTHAKTYSDLFEKRHKGDYNDFFDYDEETVNRLYPKAIALIEVIKQALCN